MRARIESCTEGGKYFTPKQKILNSFKFGLVEGDTCVLRKAELGSGLE